MQATGRQIFQNNDPLDETCMTCEECGSFVEELQNVTAQLAIIAGRLAPADHSIYETLVDDSGDTVADLLNPPTLNQFIAKFGENFSPDSRLRDFFGEIANLQATPDDFTIEEVQLLSETMADIISAGLQIQANAIDLVESGIDSYDALRDSVEVVKTAVYEGADLGIGATQAASGVIGSIIDFGTLLSGVFGNFLNWVGLGEEKSYHIRHLERLDILDTRINELERLLHAQAKILGSDTAEPED